MNVLKKMGFLLILIISFIFIDKIEVSAASHPYQVPSALKNNWGVIGGKESNRVENGTRLMYDVYSNKYISGGYTIKNMNFNNTGSQPYLRFTGWAILSGHKHHTTSNNETYIGLENAQTGALKIYSTLKIDIDATDDLAYNKQANGTLWNPCPTGAINRYSDSCNMRYESVGFDAYLPLNELFPDSQKAGQWNLYLIKKVDSQVVYVPLILPFQFDNKPYNYGELSLSSGKNTNNLYMMTEPVLRRSYKNEAAASVQATLGSDRYFTKNQIYTRTSSDESGTAIWYGVRSPKDGNATKYAQSGYWGFGGNQAVLSFNPDDTPPTHIFHDMTYTYKNGNNYWVRPNQNVSITLRQYDLEAGNLYQYLRLYEGNQNIDVRARHEFLGSTNYIDPWMKSAHISINSASRQENTQYGKVQWGVTPKTHGHSYDVQYFYQDKNNNTVGYNSTGMKLRVDGVTPVVQYRNSEDSSNFLNRDWSSSDIVVRLKFSDSDSGYKQSRYAWTQSTTVPSTWSNWTTSNNYTTNRTTKGQWYLHAQAEDNVGNIITTVQGPYKLNHPPVANYTYSPNTIYNDTTVKFTDTSTDEDGDQLTYKWEYKAPGSSNWVQFSSVKNPSSILNKKKTWNVRLTVQDDIGASSTITKNILVSNRPPVPNFSSDKPFYYEGDIIKITSHADDPDQDPLVTQYVITTPSGKTVTYNTPNFEYRAIEVGDYIFKQTVTDDDNVSRDMSKTIRVNPLEIQGTVSHTAEWEEMHKNMNNPDNVFFSGEKFLVAGLVTDYPIEKVSVTFKGVQVDGEELVIGQDLISNHPIYTGEIYDIKMSQPTTKLATGNVHFLFTAEWKNGTIKHDLVTVHIIDDVYAAFDFYRSN
ncbi:PKD domain-containing protein [Bacillaceae bacterium CLA-AA-H227]|uniref:PKD domain-containing protein n=1 Tax=Robertmurraya yapensis (ex Hitch et al 2024) TaxID=3133160 RepID=A0ACC6SH13_9BACI